MTSLNSLLRNEIFDDFLDGDLEIVFFGPGYGEAILIGFSKTSWMIIDSCVYQNDDTPAPLLYLEKLGIDIKNCVKYICATHWDDDHIQGLAKLVESCENAKLVLSSAFKSPKLLSIISDPAIELMRRENNSVKSGFNEISKIHEILKESGIKRRMFATQDRRIDILEEVEIITLSPSDDVIEKSINSIIAQIPEVSDACFRIRAPKPNHTSIVVQLRFGKNRILFGADLEEVPEHEGWSKILDSVYIKQDIVENVSALVYKVAHHGSENGHHADKPTKLLSNEVISVISPWKLGGTNLPKDTDIDRIKAYSSEVYLTTDTNNKSKLKNIDHVTREQLKRLNPKAAFSDSGFVKVVINKETGAVQHKAYGNALKVV